MPVGSAAFLAPAAAAADPPRWGRRAAERPSLASVACRGLLGLAFGAFGARALLTLAGVPAALLDRDGLPFTAQSGFSAAANAAVLIVFVCAVAAGLRVLLPEADGRPAWAVLVPVAAVAVGATLLPLGWLCIIAAVLALRWLAYTPAGAVRVPLSLPPRVTALALAALVAAGLTVAATHAWLHPFAVLAGGGPVVDLTPRTAAVTVFLKNEGRGSVQVLGVDPVVTSAGGPSPTGTRVYPESGSGTRRLTSLRVAPGEATPPLSLRFSRRGCRPGTATRVDRLVVRYAMRGERTMRLPLDVPVVVRC